MCDEFGDIVYVFDGGVFEVGIELMIFDLLCGFLVLLCLGYVML